MDLIVTAAIAFALSQVVLSGLLLARQDSWAVQERIYGVLLLGVAAYLLQPFLQSGAWSWLAMALQTAVPGLFWLFSASLFDDHFQLKRWQVSVVAATVVLPLCGRLLQAAGVESFEVLLFTLPQIAEILLVGLTLFAVARYWRGDLVAPRRRLRLWFCAINGMYILLLILLREVVLEPGALVANWQYLPIGGLLLATNAILLDYKQGVLKPPTPAPATGITDTRVEAEVEPGSPASPQTAAGSTSGPAKAQQEDNGSLLETLQKLMEEEEVYREMGLTIGRLAARLELPEYRLRQAINQGMGYRNFNDFLNTWRIRKAAARLGDPLQRELPVLTIAMDCGFRSLSSFNKAFREQQGITPTAYRQRQLDK